MSGNASYLKMAGKTVAVLLAAAALIAGYHQWQQVRSSAKSVQNSSVRPESQQGLAANGLASERPSFQFPPIRTEDRDYLKSVYRDTWNYIADFVEPATGLPYDSNKMQPATSVSNIGLYLSSAAIAYRTGLISKEDALSRINAAFSSLKKLETWRGFPRVWAAVRTLKPIYGTDTFSYSEHVANLIGGLTLMQTIFPEEFHETVGSYFRGMQFKDMYDAGTGWVKGGYDLQRQDFAVNQPFGPWHYKYLASESRLISYYLIARGFAPASHWTSLLRTIQSGSGDWFMIPGMEDGGAYMPYMAGLFVDERDMLIGTSQKNYSHSSMKHAEEIGAPVWGWSASLDTRGKYVPHGQLRDELVAPYASMLAVHYFPKEVVSNLRTLEKMGARPETEVQRTEEISSAFADERSVNVSPYAFVFRGAVFLMDSKGALKPLKDYLDSSTAGQAVDLQSCSAELELFLKAVNDPAYQNKPVMEVVQSAWRGTGLRDGLTEIAGGREQLQVILALAAKTGEYQLGNVRLANGTLLKALWIDKAGVWIPKAIAYQTDIYFLSKSGHYEKLSGLLDNTDKDQVVSGYNRRSVAFAAAVTGFSDALKEDGSVLLRGTRFSMDLKSQSGSDPEFAAQISALASVAGEYHPAKLQFKNGQSLELGLGHPGIQWAPWAAGKQGEVYFLNQEGILEKLSSYIKKTSLSKKTFVYDTAALDKLLQAAKISIAAGPLPPGISQESLARPGDFLNPAILNAVSVPDRLTDLCALAVSAGLYQPGQIRLPDGAAYAVLWKIVDKKNVPWAIAAESDVFFISDQNKIESLKKYLDKSSALEVKRFDLSLALDLLKASGFLPADSKERPSINKMSASAGSTFFSSLAEQVQDVSQRAALVGLAVQSGLYSGGSIQLSKDNAIFAAWTDRPVSRTPWAMAGAKEVVFMSPGRESIENISAYLDQTRVKQPVEDLDRRTLAVFAEVLGFKPAAGKNAEDFFRGAFYGTQIKPELRKEVTNTGLRQALLGLSAKAGLYTPAQIELEDGSRAALLLENKNGRLGAVAAAKEGKVFFLGRDRQAHALANDENARAGRNGVVVYNRESLEELASALGLAFHQGDLLRDQVQSIKLGTLQSPYLTEILSDPEALPELEALAVSSHAIQPTKIQLADSSSWWIALKDSFPREVPFAAAVEGGKGADVSFVNRDGIRTLLSGFLDNAAAGRKTKNYDGAGLKDLLLKAGVPVTGPAPEAVLGTAVKSGLRSQVLDPQLRNELLALAGEAALYKPAFVELEDAGKVPVLFVKKGDLYQPWAVAYGKKIYFKNGSKAPEEFDTGTENEPAQVIASGSNPAEAEFLSGRNMDGDKIPRIFYRALSQERLRKPLTGSLLSAGQEAELLGLAASQGLYRPVHAKLTSIKTTNYGFRDSVNWKTGAVTPYYLMPSQAMAFLSLSNFLYDGVVWKAFSENAKIKNTLDKLREMDKAQDLPGGPAQRSSMLFPKNQARAA